MEEVWKTIKGYEDYQVSDLGNVKSLKFGKERVLKPFLIGCRKRNNQYFAVDLHSNGIRKTIKIHKLVSMTFLNHMSIGLNGLICDHINNNPLDNRLSNLQLISQRENASKDKKNCSSIYTGVAWNKVRKKWVAHITIGNSLKNLGGYVKELEASNAYQLALKGL